MMPRKLLYICLMFASSSCEFIISEMTEITTLEHLRLSNNVSVVVSTSSVLNCAVECAKNVSCLSLSYNHDQGSCRIYSVLFSSDMVGSIPEDGWKSYKRKEASCPIDRGYIYNQSLDWCYLLVTGLGRNAQAAIDYCSLGEAHMIRISSMQKQLHISDFLRSREVESLWIGGHSANNDDIFEYEDSTALPFTYWYTNNPTGKKHINIQLANNYFWKNGGGTNNRDFMCEI